MHIRVSDVVPLKRLPLNNRPIVIDQDRVLSRRSEKELPQRRHVRPQNNPGSVRAPTKQLLLHQRNLAVFFAIRFG
jgi:hypothetical protein